MFPIIEATHCEFNGQALTIYKMGVDWIFLSQDMESGVCKGLLCLCFQQANDVFDTMMERSKIWVN